jgi:hypothetical protein
MPKRIAFRRSREKENMKSLMSKLAGVFAMLMLLAAAAATATSQTDQKVSPTQRKTSTERIKVINDLKNQPDTSEIRCRGGGFYFETVGSRVTSSGDTMLTLSLHFNYSLTWADREILPNGEVIQPHWNFNPSSCAWVQSGERGPYRPLSREELGEIRFETPANDQLKQTLHGTPVDRSPTAAERYPDAQTIPKYLSDANHYWSFYIATSVRNTFVANAHKYWKPGITIRPTERIKNDSPYVLKPKPPE